MFHLGQRSAGSDWARYGFPQLGLLRLRGGSQGLGVRYGGPGRGLRLGGSQRIKEKDGAESPQLSFGIGGVLGFKNFLRLGDLGLVFRRRGQFPGSQVTGDEAMETEFPHQHGLPFRGKGLIQVVVRTAFHKRRDSVAAYVEMGREGRGLRDCHDESKDQRLTYLKRPGTVCQFRSAEAVPWAGSAEAGRRSDLSVRR